MTAHRPASDESLNRTIVVQAFYLSVVSYVFAGFLMGTGLVGVPAGIIALIGIPFFCYGLSKAVREGTGFLAEKGIGGLLAAGNIKYQQGYSIQESLIARGRFDEAVESFQNHLLEFPDDIPARLRLATLHLRERKDHASAEEELLAIRRRPHDRGTGMYVANHLVDLYRSSGQTGKLMAELKRMMRDWPGTPMADGAGKLLTEVARERRGADA